MYNTTFIKDYIFSHWQIETEQLVNILKHSFVKRLFGCLLLGFQVYLTYVKANIK